MLRQIDLSQIVSLNVVDFNDTLFAIKSRLSLMGDDAPPRAVSHLSDFLIDKTRVSPHNPATLHEEDGRFGKKYQPIKAVQYL